MYIDEIYFQHLLQFQIFLLCHVFDSSNFFCQLSCHRIRIVFSLCYMYQGAITKSGNSPANGVILRLFFLICHILTWNISSLFNYHTFLSTFFLFKKQMPLSIEEIKVLYYEVNIQRNHQIYLNILDQHGMIF